jgi:hypothetical protein
MERNWMLMLSSRTVSSVTIGLLWNGSREYGILSPQFHIPFRALLSSSFVFTVQPMPRGNPKQFTNFRIDRQLLAEVRALTTNLTQAVEEGLRWWLARAKRRRRKPPMDNGAAGPS